MYSEKESTGKRGELCLGTAQCCRKENHPLLVQREGEREGDCRRTTAGRRPGQVVVVLENVSVFFGLLFIQTRTYSDSRTQRCTCAHAHTRTDTHMHIHTRTYEGDPGSAVLHLIIPVCFGRFGCHLAHTCRTMFGLICTIISRSPSTQ